MMKRDARRISTAMQKTVRQVKELVAFAKSNRLNFDGVNSVCLRNINISG